MVPGGTPGRRGGGSLPGHVHGSTAEAPGAFDAGPGGGCESREEIADVERAVEERADVRWA